jgi:hypothetical protein
MIQIKFELLNDNCKECPCFDDEYYSCNLFNKALSNSWALDKIFRCKDCIKKFGKNK